MKTRIEKILNNKESQNLEFKEKFTKEVIETVTSFSNTSGGIIAIGVSNEGKPKGIKADEETIKEWTNQIKQTTQPQLLPEIKLIEVENKTLAIINVQEYPLKPVSFKGKYYKRIGASNHIISLNEIVELQLYSINSSFDSFTTDTTFEELDENLLTEYFAQIKETGRLKLEKDNKTKLQKIGLLKGDKATLAALLLFGEHRTNIHIGRFKTRDIIIDEIKISEPLVRAIDESMNFIKKNIAIRFKIEGELRRKEIWQYPITALRELLLNSVIHKDYRNPTDIIIKIYDDSIEFTNPGTIMFELKIEDIRNGDYVAYHRNKLLAESFYLRGDVEKFGTGFQRVFRDLESYNNVDFRLESISGFTKAILSYKNEVQYRDSVRDGRKGMLLYGDIDVTDVTDNVTNTRRDFLIKLMEENSTITTEEAAKRLKVTRRTIARDIDFLKKKGKLRRIGTPKSGKWKISKP